MLKRLGGWGAVATFAAAGAYADYSAHPEAQAFVDEMVAKHALERDTVEGVLSRAQRRPEILEAIARPAEKTKPWHEYRRIFLTDERVAQGAAFARRHDATLRRAESEFGVPPAYVVAILGVETFYGKYRGKHRVVDALTTLAFDYPPRAAFFRSELEQFLLLAREQGFDPLELKGSYAGAMGYGQFISSSYRHYAVDFDGDGVVDILGNIEDAIGSVAHYFARHGWQRDAGVVVSSSLQGEAQDWDEQLKPHLRVADLPAGLEARTALPGDTLVAPFMLRGEDGEEWWLALNNFYVITRYNHSKLYAMAVHRLAQAIEAAQ